MEHSLESGAARSADALWERHPNLHPDEVAEIAYEAWWNRGVHVCEDLGLDADDERNEAAWSAAYVARYDAHRAESSGPKWASEALRALVTDLGASPDANRVDRFLMASQIDADPRRDSDAYAALLRFAFGLSDAPPTRFDGKRPQVDEDPGWSELFGPPHAWGDAEVRLCRFVARLPRKQADPARDWVFRKVTDALRVEAEGHDTWAAVRPALAELESGGATLERCAKAPWAGLAGDAPPSRPRRVSSMGRWLVTVPFDTVFPAVVGAQRVSYYAELLLHAAPDVFDANAGALLAALESREAWRVDAAAAMLRTDPERWEATVLGWLDGLEPAALRAPLLTYLACVFGDRHRKTVLDGTARVLAELGTKDVSTTDALRADPDLAELAAFPNSSAKLCLVASVLRAYGAEAVSAVQGYQHEKPGLRIRFLETLARWAPGDPAAGALVARGLDVDLPEHIGGTLTRQGYFERLAAALRAFDLAPHVPALKSALTRVPDDCREPLARLLG
ncbi:MAG: hypothetical protein H6737_14090 [Alphaproteobacteria bacterium]|nr:hypothetical protein [Alphaproteobacteria bacterium]